MQLTQILALLLELLLLLLLPVFTTGFCRGLQLQQKQLQEFH